MNGMKARSKKQEARSEKREAKKRPTRQRSEVRGQRPEGRIYGPIHGPVSFDGEIVVGLVHSSMAFVTCRLRCYHILTMVVSPLGPVVFTEYNG